jgi:hypothetical protein
MIEIAVQIDNQLYKRHMEHCNSRWQQEYAPPQ